MVFGAQKRERQQGDVIFHPIDSNEYNIDTAFGGVPLPQNLGVRPKYKDYLCGECGKSTSGRVLCDLIRTQDGATVSWCLCSCDRDEPSLIIEKDGTMIAQLPISREFHANPNWPEDLRNLYEESAKSYAANAFTASTMLCRKILMVCAALEGSPTDKSKNFQDFVDYIITNVLSYPKAKASIDAIRTIGNEANHEVHFVAEQDARRALQIVTYMLNAVYALPAA